jgi:hypothetical protein
MVRRRAASIVLACVCGCVLGPPSAAAAAPARDSATAGAPVQAHAAAIPPFLRNIARRWVRVPPKKIAKTVAKRVIKRAGRKWLTSGGTECVFPFPDRFCTQRARNGLGQALYWGGPPGVWSRTYSPRREISSPLVVGQVYYLTCWLLGDRIYGPYGSTDLWYRVTNGGYVSDALLYTGTNYVIRGVAHC